MNAVRPLAQGGIPSADTSVIVYGVRLETAWNSPNMMFSVDAYDTDKQAVKGNCWHLDKAEALVSGTPGATRYFAFEVPVGHYVFGAWSITPLQIPERVFYAGNGETVYLGNFIYNRDKQIVIQRDLDSAKPEILAALPKTPATITLAQAQRAGRVALFLCTP